MGANGESHFKNCIHVREVIFGRGGDEMMRIRRSKFMHNALIFGAFERNEKSKAHFLPIG